MKIPFEDALSLYTGRLFSKDFSRLHELYDYATGDTLFTHQLPRAFNEVTPWIKRWWPELEAATPLLGLLERRLDAKTPMETRESLIADWLKCVKAELSELNHEYELQRIPRDDHEVKCPIEEAESMFGVGRVITLTLEAPDEV